MTEPNLHFALERPKYTQTQVDVLLMKQAQEGMLVLICNIERDMRVYLRCVLGLIVAQLIIFLGSTYAYIAGVL